jgi:hypothetical protein
VSDWDQFETNKRLFNVRSSFNEDLYTKKLDLTSTTKEQIARADRIAKEIEGSSSRYSRYGWIYDRWVYKSIDGWIDSSIYRIVDYH